MSRLVAAIGVWALLAAVPVVPALAWDSDRPALGSGPSDPEGLIRAIRRGWNQLFGDNEVTAPAVAPADRAKRTARRSESPCERSSLGADEMRELQALLNEILRDKAQSAGEIDGNCGPRTETAIRTFQRDQHLSADGVPTTALLGRVREVGATVANRAIMEPLNLSGDPALWSPDQSPAVTIRSEFAAPTSGESSSSRSQMAPPTQQ